MVTSGLDTLGLTFYWFEIVSLFRREVSTRWARTSDEASGGDDGAWTKSLCQDMRPANVSEGTAISKSLMGRKNINRLHESIHGGGVGQAHRFG